MAAGCLCNITDQKKYFCPIVHQVLTVSAASPPLKDEAIWHSAISTQRRQLPVANDDRRKTPTEDQQVVAQV